MGRLVGLWVKRSHGGVMDARLTGELVAGRGLRGNATQGGRRQVTLLSLDRWRSLTAHLPGPPDPAIRRANLLVDGIDFDRSRGKVLVIGDAHVRIFGETRPCHQMDQACAGLRDALSRAWGGGAFGEVLVGGAIALETSVAWVDVATDDAAGDDPIVAPPTPAARI